MSAYCDTEIEQDTPITEQPSIDELMAWDNDGGCEALDGCWVETDGHCEHGYPSWMLHLGLI